MVILAISSLALIGVSGLALDGGRVYAERREMQNAADAAAMAATRQLDLYLTDQTADASTIEEAAKDSATTNGADPADITCELVRFDRSIIEPCPTTATMSPGTKAVAAGVLIKTASTQPTFFMKALGNSSFRASADAIAQIGRPGGRFVAPFLVCATAPGHQPPLLIPDPDGPEGFSVNPDAIGEGPYDLYGNDIKQDGKDCGNDSSSFRGNVCADKSKCDDPEYTMPGPWDADTGNANGPTTRLVNSGNVCSGAYEKDCVLVLPLCPRGNGQTGSGFAMFCSDLGLFQVTKVEPHDIDGTFLGRASVNTGGIVGPADPNGARIVALTA